mmetsp:Transcript_15664/g.34038  ORF Transcript_15664/g.34038 Transcript_15664/m.34038 type:complete len:635 (-) Transcript_15664:233-2137(-)
MGEKCSKGCSPADVCGEGGELRHEGASRNVLGGSTSAFTAEDGRLGALRGGDVELTSKRFALVRPPEIPSRGVAEWCRKYRIGRELGSGQSAIAYEAVALPSPQDVAHAPMHAGYVQLRSGAAAGQVPNSALPASMTANRVVALKRFRSVGSVAFRQELKLLAWVGGHPHVLRLLEAFTGKEDVLILEHCELGDMYEHYVRHGQAGLPEAHAAEFARQLLLALRHLASRRVEHRDVKPENLLLYKAGDESEVPLLKLGDFGWATISMWGDKPPSVPAEGCGSLWYAPPELNPPMPGLTLPPTVSAPPLGSCDLWSLGVITYLLLCGHSPFNTALRIRDPHLREQEILKMAALAKINIESPNWQRLSKDAQHFCLSLIKPLPTSRITIKDALNHPFLKRAVRAPKCAAIQDVNVPVAVLNSSPRRALWDSLDGLQRLCWLATASAVSEPEVIEAFHMPLDDVVVRLHSSAGESSYLEELAIELAAVAQLVWFKRHALLWSEVLRLAYRYLDVGMDGLLSVEDLTQHVLGDGAAVVVQGWLRKWRRHTDDCLSFEDFRSVLEASANGQPDENSHGAFTAPAAALGSNPSQDALTRAGLSGTPHGQEHSSFFGHHDLMRAPAPLLVGGGGRCGTPYL